MAGFRFTGEAGDLDWNNPKNWDKRITPSSADDVVIPVSKARLSGRDSRGSARSVTLVRGAALEVLDEATLTIGPGLSFFQGAVDIRGGATLILNGNATWSFGGWRIGAPGPSNTVSGSTVENHGTLQISGDRVLGGDGILRNHPGATIISDGKTTILPLLHNSGGLIDIRGGALMTQHVEMTAGEIIVGQSATLGGSTAPRHMLLGGKLSVMGNVKGSVKIIGGELHGTGTIDGMLENLAGKVVPGPGPATLRIQRDFVQSPEGVLELELGDMAISNQSDMLEIDGTARLDGEMRIQLLPSFRLASDKRVEVLRYNDRQGAFARFFGLDLSPEGNLRASYVKLHAGTAGSVVIGVESPHVCQLPSAITFDIARSIVKPTSHNKNVLQSVQMSAASPNPATHDRLLLAGHTDAPGSPTTNNPLSERRARSVYALLTGDVAEWETLFTTENWSAPELTEMVAETGEAARGDPAAISVAVGRYGGTGQAAISARSDLFRRYFDALLMRSGPPPITFVPQTPWLGCGEDHLLRGTPDNPVRDPSLPTITGNYEPNRRVEFFFADSGISIPISCADYPYWTRVCSQHTPPSFNAREWAHLVSFRPPTAIQIAVKDKGINWHVHRIEDGYGDINLDYYPVMVTLLPKIGGNTVSAEQLLSHIRLNFNNFVNTNNSEFKPYPGVEVGVWDSSAPLGSVVSIDFKLAGGLLNPDSGSVVVSEFTPAYWIFSAIWTVGDLGHPVSGNRQFGFVPAGGGNYVFYTRGADRATSLLDTAIMRLVFANAHELWLSLQQGIASFVNGNGGSARVDTATSIRTPWPPIQSTYHRPTVSWV